MVDEKVNERGRGPAPLVLSSLRPVRDWLYLDVTSVKGEPEEDQHYPDLDSQQREMFIRRRLERVEVVGISELDEYQRKKLSDYGKAIRVYEDTPGEKLKDRDYADYVWVVRQVTRMVLRDASDSHLPDEYLQALPLSEHIVLAARVMLDFFTTTTARVVQNRRQDSSDTEQGSGSGADFRRMMEALKTAAG